MMGLAKIAPDGWAYYAREIAAGVEDYFVGHGEETGRWIGGPVIAELREALVELVGHLGELADVGESALPAERPDGHSDGPRGNVLRTLCVMTFVIPLVRLTRAFVVVGVVLTAGDCSSHTAAAVNHPTPRAVGPPHERRMYQAKRFGGHQPTCPPGRRHHSRRSPRAGAHNAGTLTPSAPRPIDLTNLTIHTSHLVGGRSGPPPSPLRRDRVLSEPVAGPAKPALCARSFLLRGRGVRDGQCGDQRERRA